MLDQALLSDMFVELAQDRLDDAHRTGQPCLPVRSLIGENCVDAAYAVQELGAARRLAADAQIVGRKIGLTSDVVQRQLGVDQPDFGILFDDMRFYDGDTLPADFVMQPRAEAEIAFILGEDLVEGCLDDQQVRESIGCVLGAIEVCGSRIAQWDISFADTVADNASAGAFVLGRNRLPLEAVEPREVTMSMSIQGQVVSTGTGDACLGDPIAALVWLAQLSREFGRPLMAGQLVLSGALGPMRPVVQGQHVRADFSNLGSVEFSIGEFA